LSLSKYADCLLVFVNQTGAPGSIVAHLRCSSKAEWPNPKERAPTKMKRISPNRKQLLCTAYEFSSVLPNWSSTSCY
jgi:hypothetical protein